MFRLLDEAIGDKILRVWKQRLKGSLIVSQRLARWKATFIAGLPQSPIVYSPYADGSLKSKEDLEDRSGPCQRRFVQYVPDRSLVEKKTTRPMLSTTWLHGSDGIEKLPWLPLLPESHGRSKEAMYDYLIRDMSPSKTWKIVNRQGLPELAESELREGGYHSNHD